MRLNLISLAAGMFVILPIASTIEARAEKLNCSAYAATAVAQNDQNVLQKCGFAGPAWSSDLGGHMKWCETANMGMLVKEDNARKNALAQCAQKPKLDQQACQSYAKAAVEHQIANRSQGCGFAGGGWSENHAAHFDWCLTANPAARSSENNTRFQQLQGCFTAQKAAKKQACAGYASTAVEQQKENLSRGCKFTGGLWSANYAAHANWCEGVSKEASEKESELRYAALKDQCLKRICHWTRHCRGFPYFDCTTSTKCSNVPR